ncbi:hypothetical protein ACN27J_11805 [Solwaraspora sp. WMMB762]|uniref:hypothetical protein n=1 Tax=Solwaraspora sp. WMMB762 TaxID=3404120 RepID=UPI003B95527E
MRWRRRLLAGVLWSWLAVARRVVGLRDLPALVDEIRCPRCGRWVRPRRFDLLHMACRTCMATLGRPVRWSGR